MIRLIVVDDNPADIELVGIAIEPMQHDVTMIPCLRQSDPVGFLTAQARVDDIILIDLNMPGLDGFTVLERVRSARPDLRRIAILTGSPNPADRQRALALGAGAFLRKPDRFAEWPDLLTAILALAAPPAHQ